MISGLPSQEQMREARGDIYSLANKVDEFAENLKPYRKSKMAAMAIARLWLDLEILGIRVSDETINVYKGLMYKNFLEGRE